MIERTLRELHDNFDERILNLTKTSSKYFDPDPRKRMKVAIELQNQSALLHKVAQDLAKGTCEAYHD